MTCVIKQRYSEILQRHRDDLACRCRPPEARKKMFATCFESSCFELHHIATVLSVKMITPWFQTVFTEKGASKVFPACNKTTYSVVRMFQFLHRLSNWVQGCHEQKLILLSLQVDATRQINIRHCHWWMSSFFAHRQSTRQILAKKLVHPC